MGQAIGHFGEKLTFKICKRILDKIMVKFEMGIELGLYSMEYITKLLITR